MFTKDNKPQSRIDTLIGAGTTVTGDITFAGGLRIDGEIKGNVRATSDQSSTLVISEQARIDGEVAVAHLVINGTVVGPVVSTGFLELQPKARVTGDIQYNSIEMHLGAVVEGRMVHTGQPGKSIELKLAASSN
ncbi:MAG: polymer-forming cytoskeletal protein [Gammaproteobacteria bacterium]|nr:polymer-forming cytoskeletal protein [Gammaproteobacteria bacterium]MBU1414747.1 polymer-forming cytoskeletal protein [Gammaproteobacteria bacterium]